MPLGVGSWLMPGVHQFFEKGVPLATYIAAHCHLWNMEGHVALGLDKESLGWRRPFYPSLVPLLYKVNSKSVLEVKPGVCSEVVGYQVDNFIHTCSVDLPILLLVH